MTHDTTPTDTDAHTEFRLTIRLGNDAMRTGSDIAAALRRQADRLDYVHGVDYMDTWTGQGHFIADDNGQNVGRWNIERADAPNLPDAEQVARIVLGRNLAHEADGSASDAALRTVEFSADRVRIMLADAARVAVTEVSA
ncbi:MAG: hypothetical protein K0S37_799 [Microbacterium sp.]|jgi:hypothetical protein|nr:hypothetical protein [Microbacterium sp.]